MSGEVFVRIREGLRLRNIGYRRLLAAQRHGHRVSFIRTGNNLYIAGDEQGVGQFADPAEFESINDVIEFERGTDASAIEEIQLNDFEEINIGGETEPLLETSLSSTPALAGGGGALAGGTTGVAAGVPGATAVVTGVTIAGGIIAIGTTAGILSNTGGSADDNNNSPAEEEHKDPVVSFPDHRYIGPGNTVDSAVPVDTDDEIAREHDIAYERAQTEDDIHEADKQGASEFLTDVIETGNPHSIAGYIGLKAKETIERNTGVIYGLSPTGKQWVDIVGVGILIIGLISALIGMA